MVYLLLLAHIHMSSLPPIPPFYRYVTFSLISACLLIILMNSTFKHSKIY